jgi:hypothetical protein
MKRATGVRIDEKGLSGISSPLTRTASSSLGARDHSSSANNDDSMLSLLNKDHLAVIKQNAKLKTAEMLRGGRSSSPPKVRHDAASPATMLDASSRDKSVTSTPLSLAHLEGSSRARPTEEAKRPSTYSTNYHTRDRSPPSSQYVRVAELERELALERARCRELEAFAREKEHQVKEVVKVMDSMQAEYSRLRAEATLKSGASGQEEAFRLRALNAEQKHEIDRLKTELELAAKRAVTAEASRRLAESVVDGKTSAFFEAEAKRMAALVKELEEQLYQEKAERGKEKLEYDEFVRAIKGQSSEQLVSVVERSAAALAAKDDLVASQRAESENNISMLREEVSRQKAQLSKSENEMSELRQQLTAAKAEADSLREKVASQAKELGIRNESYQLALEAQVRACTCVQVCRHTCVHS